MLATIRRLCALALLLPSAASAQDMAVGQELLLGSGVGPMDEFGIAVDLQGDTAVIGAPGEPNSGEGVVYVFTHDGQDWSEDVVLTPSGGSLGKSFGAAVALDGDVLAVGAWGDDVDGTNAGAVYVFRRIAGVWSEEAELRSSLPNAHDYFGWSVDVRGDRLVTGAYRDRGNGSGSERGTVYAFQHDGASWNQTQILEPLLTNVGNQLYGYGLTVWDDFLVVIALRNDSFTGQGYSYELVGGQWVLGQEILSPDGSNLDLFGESVDTDGSTLAVGAPGHDDPINGAGAVYTYIRSGTSWDFEDKLVPSGNHVGDRCGSSVSVDGDVLAAGSVGSDFPASNMGAGHLFVREGGAWREDVRLHSTTYGSGFRTGTGAAVDGDHILIGAGESDLLGDRAGAAFAYSIAELDRIATGFGFGDGSAGPCPCGNESALQRGCTSQFGQGAVLTAVGSTSVSADDLLIGIGGLPFADTAMILFVGDASVPAVMLADGLRFAGGHIERYGAKIAPEGGGGMATYGPGLAAAASLSVGTTYTFQSWYRDKKFTACGNDSNLTSGLQVTFTP